MWARHARSLKPVDIRDVRIAASLGALTTLLPISALDETTNPLADTFLSSGGVWGIAVPIVVGGYLAVPLCIYVLRRMKRSSQRMLSIVAGIFVGLIPFLFYCILELSGMVVAPLSSLAVRGVVSGSFLGLLAAWYVPRGRVPMMVGVRLNSCITNTQQVVQPDRARKCALRLTAELDEAMARQLRELG